mmetsp:Transcript_7629/g.10867  ORF Transcript_7629/g.10867 Transcript_7629/m.10867 type:complete len:98 (-) Transcript_7629:138-431(-)
MPIMTYYLPWRLLQIALTLMKVLRIIFLLNQEHPKKHLLDLVLPCLPFFVIRTGWELGRDPMGGFDVNRMIANGKTMETWKLGMLGFSVYNVLRSFM